MLTDPDIATPTQTTAADRAEAEARPPRPRAARRRRGRLGTVAGLGLVVGLVGFNGWWYWRDTRPLADSRTVSEWIARGEYDRAESALRERLRRAPHDGEARLALARALAGRGDLIGCARELQGVRFWWPRKAEARFRAAQAFLMADRARDAEAELMAILDADPLHPPDRGLYHDAGQELLKIYATEDRWEDAYPVIWKCFDHAAPVDRPLMLTMRIRCELERVAPAERLKVLRRYVAADPDDLEALRALADAELAVGQRAEALRDIETCLRRRPDDPRAWRGYLTMLQSMGERSALVAAMARMPKSAESEPAIWMLRGELKERDGDWAGASGDYRRALELDPNRLDAHYRLATIEARLGHADRAAPHRRRWEELRQAQSELRQVDAEYNAALAAASAPQAGPSDLAGLRAASRRLGSACERLGWARAAEACRQIAASL